MTHKHNDGNEVLRCRQCMEAVASQTCPRPTGRPARIAFLERKREATKADLLVKFEDSDYHGVADAAMDLRDIDSELAGLRY